MKKYLLALLLAAAPVIRAQTLFHTLPNGMKILVKEDRRAPVAAVRLWYRVGSVDEQPGKSGLSHALEHMMFKGTTAVPAGEFSRRIAALGGSDNAYTTRTETVYTVDIAARHLPEVLTMEADRMAGLNFSNRDFLNEMNVIREERRMRTDDSPAGKLWETVNLHLWNKPFNRAPVIGYAADLDTLTAEDLRSWYHSRYAPNNALLVIVGDVDATQTVRLAADTFGRLKAKPLPARNDETEAPSAAKAGKITARSPATRQPLFNISRRVAPQTGTADRQAHALTMLAQVLAGTASSRYDKTLVRGKGSALGISAGYEPYGRHNAVFSVSAMPSGKVPVAALAADLEAGLRDIAVSGVRPDELERIRTALETERIYARDSIRRQADILGEAETNGFGYNTEETELQQLLSITPEEVRQAAARLLEQPALTTIVVPETAAQE